MSECTYGRKGWILPPLLRFTSLETGFNVTESDVSAGRPLSYKFQYESRRVNGNYVFLAALEDIREAAESNLDSRGE